MEHSMFKGNKYLKKNIWTILQYKCKKQQYQGRLKKMWVE